MKVMASAFFRFLGAVGRTAIVGNTFGALALMTILIFGGYMLSRGEFKINFDRKYRELKVFY